MNAQSKLPFADSSMHFVFSAHFFEHLDDPTVQNLFNESYRVLRPGGAIRFETPDFELALNAYNRSDHKFFDGGSWGLAPRYENWTQNDVEPSLENKLSFVFFGYSNMDDQGKFPAWHYFKDYYCGPAKIENAALKKAIETMNIHQLSKWLYQQRPKTYFDLGHINVFDFPKFNAFLTNAGFREVYLSSYGGSKFGELRQADFDNRPDISLFVEAVK